VALKTRLLCSCSYCSITTDAGEKHPAQHVDGNCVGLFETVLDSGAEASSRL